MRHRANFFYMDDGMVALTYPFWLQGDFNTLAGLFDSVVLCKNARKTVGVICRPCRAEGIQLETA